MRWSIACLAMVMTATAHAGGIIDLGSADEFTFSQPVVQTRVGGFQTFLNEYLLDTGASGILVGANASTELAGQGLETEASYIDFGVAGPETTRVSRPYDFSFAGSDGGPLTLPNTRIQTSSGDYGFYSGIAGMPLMVNRTVGLDLTAQADMNAIRIGVAFGTGRPPTAGLQYSVPLTMREFPMTGQAHPSDPLPVAAPLPFLPVRAAFGEHRLDGSFLLDTGAQQCILSSSAAFGLGLDVNGDGSLDDEAISFQTVAGVGGAVTIPVLRVDSLSIRAADGFDIRLRDVPVGIVDIDPSISGVLGMNMLNSGWEAYSLNVALGLSPGPSGIFNRVDLDFRDAATTLRGEMRLTLNADRLSSGTLEVAAGSTLALGPQLPSTVAGLVNRGLVDVGTGRLTVTAGLSGTDVRDQIAAVINGGTTGITSSDSAASGGAFTVGWLDNYDGSFTFGYAATGDTNLDNVVDLTDLLNMIGSGKYDAASAATWADGDTNYDGVVDLTDLLGLIGGGLYDQGSYIPAPRSRHVTMIGGARTGEPLVFPASLGNVTAVPEPSGAVLLVAAMVGASVVWRRRVGKSFGW